MPEIDYCWMTPDDTLGFRQWHHPWQALEEDELTDATFRTVEKAIAWRDEHLARALAGDEVEIQRWVLCVRTVTPAEPVPTSEHRAFIEQQLGYMVERIGLTFGDDEQREYLIGWGADELERAFFS